MGCLRSHEVDDHLADNGAGHSPADAASAKPLASQSTGLARCLAARPPLLGDVLRPPAVSAVSAWSSRGSAEAMGPLDSRPSQRQEPASRAALREVCPTATLGLTAAVHLLAAQVPWERSNPRVTPTEPSV